MINNLIKLISLIKDLVPVIKVPILVIGFDDKCSNRIGLWRSQLNFPNNSTT